MSDSLPLPNFISSSCPQIFHLSPSLHLPGPADDSVPTCPAAIIYQSMWIRHAHADNGSLCVLHGIHAYSNRCERLKWQLRPSGLGWTSVCWCVCARSGGVHVHVNAVISINMYGNARRKVVNKTWDQVMVALQILFMDVNLRGRYLAVIVRTSQYPV